MNMWPSLIAAPVCSSTAKACFVRCLFTWLALPVKACFEFQASACLQLGRALVVAKLVRASRLSASFVLCACNISHVYTDTNDWNESLVRMKMLYLSVSAGRFWPDAALLERVFHSRGGLCWALFQSPSIYAVILLMSSCSGILCM